MQNRFGRRILLIGTVIFLTTAKMRAETLEEKIEQGRQWVGTEKHKEGVAKLRETLAELEAAITKEPRNADWRFLAGKIYFYLEEDEKAEKFYDQAIELAPRESKYHFMKGILQKYHDDFAGAAKELALATELDSQDARSWFELGTVLARQEKIELALEALRKSIALDDKNVVAFFTAGCLEAERNNNPEALKLLKRATELDPRHALAHYNCGQVHQNLGQFTEALERFQTAAKLESADWRICAKIIQCCQAAGKPKERDEERGRLFKLYKEGKINKNLYCRDQFKVGDKRVMALEYFELKGDEARRYSFVVQDTAGKETLFRITLGSYDTTTDHARAAGEIGKDERLFHLDRYFPNDTHETFAFFKKEPAYDAVKAAVIEVIEDKRKPLSSFTPTKEGGVIKLENP